MIEGKHLEQLCHFHRCFYEQDFCDDAYSFLKNEFLGEEAFLAKLYASDYCTKYKAGGFVKIWQIFVVCCHDEEEKKRHSRAILQLVNMSQEYYK